MDNMQRVKDYLLSTGRTDLAEIVSFSTTARDQREKELRAGLDAAQKDASAEKELRVAVGNVLTKISNDLAAATLRADAAEKKRDEYQQLWRATIKDCANAGRERDAAQEELRKARDDLDSMKQCFEDARSQWIECRDQLRVLHEQQPVAWMNGDRARTNEQIEDIADHGYLLEKNGWTPLYAAPVPAQPQPAPTICPLCHGDTCHPQCPQKYNEPQPAPPCCPECGGPEVDAMTPRTVYACGSSDYDGRPGTFKQSVKCKEAHDGE